MRVPVFLLPLFRGAAAASVGCLLLASPILAAGPRATASSEDSTVAPVARPGASDATVAPAARPTMRKSKDAMRRVDEPAVAPSKTRPGSERVAPAGIAAPKRGMAPTQGMTPGATSPADDLRMKQAAQKFDTQAKRISGEMASERRRFATQQQSELAKENEKTMAKIREHARSEGHTAKIREQAAELMKQSEGASSSEAKAIEEEAAKLLQELERR